MLACRGQLLASRLLDRGGQQPVLGAEVVDQHARARTGRAGKLLERDAEEPALEQQLDGGVAQRLASLGVRRPANLVILLHYVAAGTDSPAVRRVQPARH
jgi:hypothetical protein